jgi:hypothetical protein
MDYIYAFILKQSVILNIRNAIQSCYCISSFSETGFRPRFSVTLFNDSLANGAVAVMRYVLCTLAMQ